MDMTGIQALEGIVDNLSGRHVRVVFCQANIRVRSKPELAEMIGNGARVTYAETLADPITGVSPDRGIAVT